MATIEETKKIKDKIWKTSKSRMNAESRFRGYDNVSHIFLVLLSIAVIASSIFLKGESSESISMLLSVFVLSTSIVVFGFRFGETAVKHRECYLRLQSLLDQTPEKEKLIRSYHAILLGYPNHLPIDYERVLIDSASADETKITNWEGEVIPITKLMHVKRWMHCFLVFWAIPVLVIILFVSKCSDWI